MGVAADHLAKFRVTVAEARNFIVANMQRPADIFNTAKQFGVTNEMLAEIYGGVTKQDVINFFDSARINSRLLDPVIPAASNVALVPSDLANSAFANLVAFNSESGTLSTSSLRNKIIAQTGADAYNKAFSPNLVAGSQDGTLTGAEIGVSKFQSFAATQDNIESLYFGTLIKVYKSFDAQEVQELANFVEKNGQTLTQQLNAGSGALYQQFLTLVNGILEDPANPPLFNDQTIFTAITTATAVVVGVASGQEAYSIFSGFSSGLISG